MNGNLRQAAVEEIGKLFEENRIAYCLLSGEARAPHSNNSDIDILLENEAEVERASRIVEAQCERIGFSLIRERHGFLVLMSQKQFNPPLFLLLDLQHQCSVAGRLVLDTKDVLADRINDASVFCASPPHAFTMSLCKAVARQHMTDTRFSRIHDLHCSGTSKCDAMLTAIFGSDAKAMASAIAQGGKTYFEDNRTRLATRLNTYLSSQTGAKQRKSRSLLVRLLHPEGFHIAMLGPDGAGKSSVVDVLEQCMTGPFNRVDVLGFAPPLYKLWRKGPVNTSTPHGRKARSVPVSIARALFWIAYAMWSHFSIRLAKARNTLLVNDRHFLDILVDPVRYRYGGPVWLLKLAAWLTPMPDAVVLLHGPAEVLQARKKELSVEETARQSRSYLDLVQPLAKGHVVNAAQGFEHVMADVCKIIFNSGSGVS